MTNDADARPGASHEADSGATPCRGAPAARRPYGRAAAIALALLLAGGAGADEAGVPERSASNVDASIPGAVPGMAGAPAVPPPSPATIGAAQGASADIADVPAPLLPAAAAALLLEAPPAAALSPQVAGPFSKRRWTVAAGWCPVGCSDATRQFLQAQVGRAVVLSPTRLDAPFVATCPGPVRFDVHSAPASAVVAAVNQGLAPWQLHAVPADLRLALRGRATTAVAHCRGPRGDVALLRLLAIEPGRILALHGDHSLIELR
ncbi:MAG: hypothetical protein ACTHL8_08750 [Burkholderiaceae bacterium]